MKPHDLTWREYLDEGKRLLDDYLQRRRRFSEASLIGAGTIFYECAAQRQNEQDDDVRAEAYFYLAYANFLSGQIGRVSDFLAQGTELLLSGPPLKDETWVNTALIQTRLLRAQNSYGQAVHGLGRAWTNVGDARCRSQLAEAIACLYEETPSENAPARHAEVVKWLKYAIAPIEQASDRESWERLATLYMRTGIAIKKTGFSTLSSEAREYFRQAEALIEMLRDRSLWRYYYIHRARLARKEGGWLSSFGWWLKCMRFW